MSYPLARMTVDGEMAHIEGVAFDAWIVRGAVDAVVPLRRWPYGQMIRFATSSGAFDGVVFMTRDRPGTGELLEGMRSLGWPVAAPDGR